jgi:ankyrin repeat protein
MVADPNEKNCDKILNLLIEKGANINMQNKNGESVLMYAVKLLLGKGADIELQDKWGKTALMHAAGGVNAIGNKYGTYTDILELLIKKGAKLEVEDNEGHTALYWAKRYNRTKSVDLLLAKGANPAKSYDKAADKSNITEGLVGIWEKYVKLLK